MSDNKLSIRLREPYTALTSPYRFSHEGWNGGASIQCFKIKSDSRSHVYSNIRASIIKIGDAPHNTSDFFTDSGWSIKLITKNENEDPTEEDWSETLPNAQVYLDDIGVTDLDGNLYNFDVETIQYLFVRVFCPGHTDPGQYKHELSLTYNSININN